MGPLPHPENKENEHEMASFFINKTKELSDKTICRKGYAYSFLGPKRRNFGVIRA
jgi:hypothetical protein